MINILFLKRLKMITDVNIIKDRMEREFGVKILQDNLYLIYKREYEKKGISYEEVEEEIIRKYYRMLYS